MNLATKASWTSYLYLLVFSLITFNTSGQNLGQARLGSEQVYTLGGVSVNAVGGSRFDEKTIVTYSGLRPGDQIKIPGDKISAAIKKLWKAKLFSDISVNVDKIDGNDLYLEIEIKELPQLSRVVVTGLSRSKQEDILKETKLSRGNMVTENLMITTKNYIEQKFIKKGYLKTKASITTERDTSETNAVVMNIHVDRGSRVKIKQIYFAGNEVLTDGKLRKAMKETKNKSLLNIFKGSKFIESNYEDDKLLVAEAYKKIGYRDARVVSDSVWWNEDNTINLQLNVSEGNQYHYRNIKWLGNSIYTKEQLDQILGISEGDLYNAELLAERINGDKNGNDISTLYMDNGYLFSQVNPVEVSAENDSIDLEIRVIEGEKAYINRIAIKGNTRTNDHVIYRQVRTRPGQLFSKSDIQRTYREIAQLGYFDAENIGIDPVPDPATNTVDINYTVSEKSSSQIELQGGWGGGQFIGTVGLSFNNFSLRNIFNKDAWKPLPLGDGQTLSLRAQASYGYQNYSFSFTEPWIGGKRPTSLSFSLYHTIENNYDYFSYEQLEGRLKITGASIGLGKRLRWPDDYFQLSSTLSFQRYDWEDYVWSSTFRDFEDGQANNLALTLGVTRNSSGPNPIYPTSGSNFSASVKLTPPYSLMNNTDYNDPELLDVDRFRWMEYYKFKMRGTWYTSIVGDLVLMTHAEFGYMAPYNSEVGTPPFERFNMGGSGMVQYRFDGSEIIALRGYQDYAITNNSQNTNEGDPIYNKFTVELRYPITLNPTSSIYVLTFAEGGNTYSDFQHYSPFELHRSAGAGVRIFMPMFGMLGFDFGYGFDPVIPGQDPKWEFHFILGQQMF